MLAAAWIATAIGTAPRNPETVINSFSARLKPARTSISSTINQRASCTTTKSTTTQPKTARYSARVGLNGNRSGNPFSLIDQHIPAMATTPAAGSAPPKAAPLKKGSLVRVNPVAYLGSLEATASDPAPPPYLFEGPGEILAVKGDYAQLRWRRPVPDVWLRLDQLEPWSAS